MIHVKFYLKMNMLRQEKVVVSGQYERLNKSVRVDKESSLMKIPINLIIH